MVSVNCVPPIEADCGVKDVIPGATVSDRARETVTPAASAKSSVTSKTPAVLGVPVNAPLAASIDSPMGRPVEDHRYGVVPPVEAGCALYAVPAKACGSALVVIDGAALMMKSTGLETRSGLKPKNES